jgi:small subunit ribosomal protein S17
MDLLPHDARRRTKVGTVVSDKMHKTVVVAVEGLKRHRLYGRTMRRTKKYHAHDEDNRCKIGDKVVIAESRPMSKLKRWRVREVIGHDVTAGLPQIEEVEVSRPKTEADAADQAAATGPESDQEPSTESEPAAARE